MARILLRETLEVRTNGNGRKEVSADKQCSLGRIPTAQVLYILRGKPRNAEPHCAKQVLLEAAFDLNLDVERVSWPINQSYDSDSHSSDFE